MNLKKNFLFAVMTTICVVASAQEVVPFVDTFDNGELLWESQDENLVTATIVSNPNVSEVNSSEKCLQIMKADTQWPGVQRKLSEKLNFGPLEDEQYAFIHLKILNEEDTELRFKFYEGATEYVYDYPVTANATWTNLNVFVGEITTFSGVPIDCYIDKILIRPNIAGTIYIDDVYVSKTQDTAVTGIRNVNAEIKKCNGKIYTISR